MRPVKELESLLAGIIKLSQGTCPYNLLAYDEAERDWFKANLKRRHGAKTISVRLADRREGIAA